MKIDQSVQSVVITAGTTRNAEIKPPQEATYQPQESTVALSPLSARMREISSSMANGSTFDPSRLSDIKQAISEGRMKVDVTKIANGLVDSVRQMLGQAQEPAPL